MRPLASPCTCAYPPVYSRIQLQLFADRTRTARVLHAYCTCTFFCCPRTALCSLYWRAAPSHPLSPTCHPLSLPMTDRLFEASTRFEARVELGALSDASVELGVLFDASLLARGSARCRIQQPLVFFFLLVLLCAALLHLHHMMDNCNCNSAL